MKSKQNSASTLVEEVYAVAITRDSVTQVVTVECWSVQPPRGHTILHRVGAPAAIYRDATTGLCIQEVWYQNGQRHREDGPALIKYSPDGQVRYVSWYNHGKVVPHRRQNNAAAAEKTPTPGN